MATPESSLGKVVGAVVQPNSQMNTSEGLGYTFLHEGLLSLCLLFKNLYFKSYLCEETQQVCHLHKVQLWLFLCIVHEVSDVMLPLIVMLHDRRRISTSKLQCLILILGHAS